MLPHDKVAIHCLDRKKDLKHSILEMWIAHNLAAVWGCTSLGGWGIPGINTIAIGNESVPKMIINDTIFFSKTIIRILVISNHDSF